MKIYNLFFSPTGTSGKINVAISNEIFSKLNAASIHDIPYPEQSLIKFKQFVMEYMMLQKSVSAKPKLPEVDKSICTERGACVSACPIQAIADVCRTIDPAKCIKCCAYVKSCLEGARSFRPPFASVLSAKFPQRKQPVWTL